MEPRRGSLSMDNPVSIILGNPSGIQDIWIPVKNLNRFSMDYSTG
jgi:hypothetical protein